jgi:hypothetical protein
MLQQGKPEAFLAEPTVLEVRAPQVRPISAPPSSKQGILSTGRPWRCTVVRPSGAKKSALQVPRGSVVLQCGRRGVVLSPRSLLHECTASSHVARPGRGASQPCSPPWLRRAGLGGRRAREASNPAGRALARKPSCNRSKLPTWNRVCISTRHKPCFVTKQKAGNRCAGSRNLTLVISLRRRGERHELLRAWFSGH